MLLKDGAKIISLLQEVITLQILKNLEILGRQIIKVAMNFHLRIYYTQLVYSDDAKGCSIIKEIQNSKRNFND